MASDLRISVVVPTYNGFRRLAATVDSVLQQTFLAHEIIVVDDGSTDSPVAFLSAYANRIRYLRVENGGQQRARNLGVVQATGDWIALLDHDDLFEPGYLAEINALVTAHGVDITMANSRTWAENATCGTWKDSNRFSQFAPPGYWQRVGANPADRWSVLQRYDLASYLAFHPAQTSMFSLRKSLYDSLGGFDPRLRGSGAENFEFEIRALRAGTVGLIWAPLVAMHRHDANASLDGNAMAIDVVACLDFSLRHHGLNASEITIVETELQHRLPDAINAAYTLGRYRKVTTLRRRYRGALPFKTELKSIIATVLGKVSKR